MSKTVVLTTGFLGAVLLMDAGTPPAVLFALPVDQVARLGRFLLVFLVAHLVARSRAPVVRAGRIGVLLGGAAGWLWPWQH